MVDIGNKEQSVSPVPQILTHSVFLTASAINSTCDMIVNLFLPVSGIVLCDKKNYVIRIYLRTCRYLKQDMLGYNLLDMLGYAWL